MKTKFICGLAAVALASCQNRQYTINIEMPSAADSTMVIMRGYESHDTADTTFTIGGKAIFAGTTDNTEIRRIESQRMYANIILEPGDIKVNLESESACGEGTDLNDKLRKLEMQMTDLNELASDKYRSIMSDASLTDAEKKAKTDALLQDFNNDIAHITDSVVAQNKTNSLGRFIFWNNYLQLIYNIDFDKYMSALNDAGEYIASYEPIKKGTAHKECYNKTKSGSKFIDFTIEKGNLDGTPVKFSDYVGNGKVVLVDFWASWCGPCRRAMPYIKAAYNKYGGDNFDVLGIAVWDQRARSLKAIEEEGMNWNLIIDAEKIPTDIYGIDGIPELILFDKDGVVIDRSFSPSDIDLIVGKALAE